MAAGEVKSIPKFQLVDVSQWPLVLVRVLVHQSIGEEGAALMRLEDKLSDAFGQRIEIYLEIKPDQNKARGEVAQRVKEWNERRLALKGNPR